MPDRLNSKYTRTDGNQLNVYIQGQPARPTAVSDLKSGSNAQPNTALGPIKFDADLGAQCAARLSSSGNLQECEAIWPAAFPHIKLMFDRLTFQQEQYEIATPSPMEMVVRSLSTGPAFTEKWGKAWKDSRFNGLDSFKSLAPDDIHGHAYTMKEYDDMYSPYFFIFWEEETDDWKYMFGGRPTHMDEEWLDRLRDKCTSIASRYSKPGDFITNLGQQYRPVASQGFDGYGETYAEWELEYDNPEADVDSPYMIAKRSVARKRPTEIRDIGILTPGSMRSHRRFMRPLQKLVSRIPSCPHGRDSDYIRNLVSNLGKKYDYFYMRDYTKSGMTVPHQVIRAVFEGVYSDNAELCNLACNFYEKGVVMVGEENPTFRRPDTGVPLGLWVEGYTIFQYAVHEMIIQDMGLAGQQIGHSATNDDMIAGFKDPDTMEDYVNRDIAINSGLSMAVKFAKSGTSYQSFFYCEEYWLDNRILSKSSLYSLGILGAKYSVNIVHAKDLCYSILMSAPVIDDAIKQALRIVQTHWGWEFSEQEVNWPYLFGGWLPQYRDGLERSIEWYYGDSVSAAAYWCARMRHYKKTKLDVKPHLTLGRKLDAVLVKEPDIPADWADLLPVFGDKKTLKIHFGKLPARAVTKRYNLLLKARAERFQDFISGRLETPDIYTNWYIRHPSSVILKTMPGVITSKDYVTLKRPRLGILNPGEVGKIYNMASMGYLTIGTKLSTLGVSRSERMLFGLGVTNELKLDKLALPLEGCAMDVLANQYSGLSEFTERTGLAVVSLRGDPGMEFVSQWCDAPHISLAYVIRIRNNLRMTNQPIDSQRVRWYADRMFESDKKKPDPVEDWGLSYIDEERKYAHEFAQQLFEQVSDLLSQEEFMDVKRSLGSRLVSRFTNEKSFSGTLEDDLKFALKEDGDLLDGLSPAEDNWMLPDDGYDIWDSLEA